MQSDSDVSDTEMLATCYRVEAATQETAWDELSVCTPPSDDVRKDAEAEATADKQRGIALRRLAFALLHARAALDDPQTPIRITNMNALWTLGASLDVIRPHLFVITGNEAAYAKDAKAFEVAAVALYKVLTDSEAIMKPVWGNSTRLVGAFYPAVKEENIARKAMRMQSDLIVEEDFIRALKKANP